MYVTLWRLLPGDRRTRALTCLGLALAAVALLWYLVFPWVEPKIQFDHSAVNGGSPAPTGSPAPPRR